MFRTEHALAAVLMATILFSTSIVMGYAPLNVAQAASETQTDKVSDECATEVHEKTHSIAKTLDYDKAKSLADATDSLQSKSIGLNLEFNSIYHTWTIDEDCNITLNDTNVVYFAKDEKGNPMKTITITEDPRFPRFFA